MRGSPLLRAAFAFIFILLLGWPLRRLTGDAPRAGAVLPAVAATAEKEIELQLTFTTIPKLIRVRHLGKEIWNDAAPTIEMERRLQIPFPKEGVDLQFDVEFSASAPLSAMRVRLTDPDGEMREKSLWGTGQIEEVVTFP